MGETSTKGKREEGWVGRRPGRKLRRYLHAPETQNHHRSAVLLVKAAQLFLNKYMLTMFYNF